jgi:hypothetical protein
MSGEQTLACSAIRSYSAEMHSEIAILPRVQHPQPRGRGVQFGLGAVLQHSRTPSLRVAGFEDESEAPCER